MNENLITEGSDDKKRILIIGSGSDGKSALAIQSLKEQYGNDIVIVTPEEAKEQGLLQSDFANIPKLKITAPPLLPELRMIGHEKSGQEKRRDRRKNERKSKARWR